MIRYKHTCAQNERQPHHVIVACVIVVMAARVLAHADHNHTNPAHIMHHHAHHHHRHHSRVQSDVVDTSSHRPEHHPKRDSSSSITSDSSTTTDQSIEPFDHPEKPHDHQIEPFDHAKQPHDHPEKPNDHQIEPFDHLEKPYDHAKKPLDHAKKPFDHRKEPHDRPEEPLDDPTEPFGHSQEPFEHPEEPLDHPEPFNHHDEPFNHPEEPFNHHDEPFNHPEKPFDHHNEPYDHPEKPFHHHNEPYDHPEEPYDHQNESYDHQNESYDRQNESYDRQNESYDHQNESYDRQNESYDHQNESDDLPDDHPDESLDYAGIGKRMDASNDLIDSPQAESPLESLMDASSATNGTLDERRMEQLKALLFHVRVRTRRHHKRTLLRAAEVRLDSAHRFHYRHRAYEPQQVEKSVLEHTTRAPKNCDYKEYEDEEDAERALDNAFRFVKVPRAPSGGIISPSSQCPTCYTNYLNHDKTNKVDSEKIRLEAIKQQILNKLGLKSRPVIKKKLPREIILQSLYRAEEDNLDFSSDENVRKIAEAVNRVPTRDPFDDAAHSSTTQSNSDASNIVQDDFYARTSEIIIFGEAGVKINSQQLMEFSLSKFSDIGDQELKIKFATLWVKVTFHPLVSPSKRRLLAQRNITLWVFRMTQHNHKTKINEKDMENHLEMVTSTSVNLGNLGWQKIDLTQAVRAWYDNVSKLIAATTKTHDVYYQDDNHVYNASHVDYYPRRAAVKRYNAVKYEAESAAAPAPDTKCKDDTPDSGKDEERRMRKLTLLIDCSGCKDLVRIHLFTTSTDDASRSRNKNQMEYEALKEKTKPDEADYESTRADTDPDNTNQPFIVIHTDPNIMKRVRRRALDCSGAFKGQCCKQRFYVNFTDLGWSDWILAPQGYYANYCMGSCSNVHRTPDTFLNYYTHVIHEYQKFTHLKGLQPCCAPTKFSSTSLIYFGPDSNIIKRDLPKMTVDECGCP